MEAFWDEIARLRDLLKFDFYFKERDEHRRQVAAEMARHDPSWEARLRSGPVAADELLAGMRPLVSTWWFGRSSRRTGSSPTCWRTIPGR